MTIIFINIFFKNLQWSWVRATFCSKISIAREWWFKFRSLALMTKLHGVCSPFTILTLKTLRQDFSVRLSILINNIRKLGFQESLLQEILVSNRGGHQTETSDLHILSTHLFPQRAYMFITSTTCAKAPNINLKKKKFFIGALPS